MKIAIERSITKTADVTSKQKKALDLLLQVRKDKHVIDGYFKEKDQALRDLNKTQHVLDPPGLEAKKHNAKITLERLAKDSKHIEQLIESCDARVEEILELERDVSDNYIFIDYQNVHALSTTDIEALEQIRRTNSAQLKQKTGT